MSLTTLLNTEKANFSLVRFCHRIGLFFLLLALHLLGPGGVFAADNWTVTVRVHEAISLSDDDADGPDDMYWDVKLSPTVGIGPVTHCDAKDKHDDDNNHITPTDWACTANVTGGANTNMQIQLVLMEHDSTSEDDEFDINPAPGQLGLLMNFKPADSQLSIVGVGGRDGFQCAPGRIRMRGSEGDDFAEIVFSVSASLVGAPDGDSDNDGLADTWEQCGIDADGDGTADVNLAAMGANRFRKDIFVEADWMIQPASGGTPGHSHEPWLPSLINAWNEFDVAQVSNPTVNGRPTRGGIALHVDTGLLYQPIGGTNYGVDSNGDGTVAPNEAQADVNGNIDLNGDGIPDIGNLGQIADPLGTIGGEQIPEVTLLAPGNLPIPPATQLTDSHAFFDGGSTFANIRGIRFNAARRWAFHYVVFGHLYADTLLAGAPTNSSGLADNCGRPTCSDFMVTLGGFTPVNGFLRQTVDTNGDGVPDLGGAILNGPSGLIVDGTFRDHTGTFLHELGHNLSLQHGGGDGINWKPNYLSIMNYSWQTRGIGFDSIGADDLPDQLGFSFDGDPINDMQRFLYSGGANNPALGPLNEGVVTTPPTGFINEAVGIDSNPANNGITRYTCPPLIPPIAPGTQNPPTIFRRGNQVLDFDCDGNLAETNVTADVNNVALSSGRREVLNGFDDYNVLSNGGLRFNEILPGIGAQEQIELDSTTTRIVEDRRGRERANFCERPNKIRFEELSPGKRISTQYGPIVTFLSDRDRSPTIAGSAERNNVPTNSPMNSLLNQTRSTIGAPLVMHFNPPQRAVSFYYGQAGITDSQRERIRVAVRAFDQRGLSMGEIRKPIPPVATGITEFMPLVTVWPDELITRLEVSYETDFQTDNHLLAEPVQIDDLLVCDRLNETKMPTGKPEPPLFGALNAQLQIQSITLVPKPAVDGDPDHFAYVAQPFAGLPITIDGVAGSTNLKLSQPEGTKLTISAPSTYGAGRFLYWKHSSGVSFGKKNDTIPFTLLTNGVLTAVYEGVVIHERHR